MKRNHNVIVKRCKALIIKSVPQPAPVTNFENSFNYFDTKKIGKHDKSNKLNDKLERAPETCKFKNCEFVLICVNMKQSKIKQRMQAHINKNHRETSKGELEHGYIPKDDEIEVVDLDNNSFLDDNSEKEVVPADVDFVVNQFDHGMESLV